MNGESRQSLHLHRALLFAAVLSFSLIASAEEAEFGTVPVEMPRSARLLLAVCDSLPFQPESLESILRVELLGVGVELEGEAIEHDENDARDRAVVTIDVPECGGTDLFISVERWGAQGSVERILELSEPLPDDVDRIVALAVAELVQRAWSDLSESQPPAPVESDMAEPLPEPSPPIDDELSQSERSAVVELLDQRAQSRRPARGNLGLIVYGATEGRSFPSHRTGMFGATAGVIVSLSSVPLSFELGVGTWYGRGVDPLGTIDIASVLGGVGLLLGGRYRALSFAVGVHLEAGWARARGQPEDDTVLGGTADSALLLMASRGFIGYSLTRRFGLIMSIDIGYVLLGLEVGADDRRVAGISSVSLAWSVGLALM